MISVIPAANGTWSQPVSGVKKGTLTVTWWGSDKVGNTATAKSYTRTITK